MLTHFKKHRKKTGRGTRMRGKPQGKNKRIQEHSVHTEGGTPRERQERQIGEEKGVNAVQAVENTVHWELKRKGDIK